MKKKILNCVLCAVAGSVVFVTGCPPPPPPPPPDPIGIIGEDVRTIAKNMGPSLLAIPEIAKANEVRRVKFTGITNKTRFVFDTDIIKERFTAEISSVTEQKLRFIDDSKMTEDERIAALLARQSRQINEGMEKFAKKIAQLPVIKGKNSVVVAVLPVLNVNSVNMNGESFLQMFRAKVSNASNGRVQILLPGVPADKADYFLAGQFIPESIKTEGIVNLANYIHVLDYRIKTGQSLDVTTVIDADVVPTEVTTTTHGDKVTSTSVVPQHEKQKLIKEETHIRELLKNPKLQMTPDVSKHLNLIFADARTKASVCEESILINQKIESVSGYANYFLSGKITEMESFRGGVAENYLLISLQLTDVENGEIVWKRDYEIEREYGRKRR